MALVADDTLALWVDTTVDENFNTALEAQTDSTARDIVIAQYKAAAYGGQWGTLETGLPE